MSSRFFYQNVSVPGDWDLGSSAGFKPRNMYGTSILLASAVQLGTDATATKNLTIRTNADGTFTLARGNVGATTQDILTIDANGRVSHVVAASMVRVTGANAYGSTNTCIRRFATLQINQGTDITYADSATLGATFTVNTSGVYTISYTDNFSGASSAGISLNSTQLTTGIAGIAQADSLAWVTAGAAGWGACAAWSGYLAAGSVIRAHGQGTASGGNPSSFTITKVV